MPFLRDVAAELSRHPELGVGSWFRHYRRFVPTRCVRAMEVEGVKRVGRNSQRVARVRAR